jgi:hypothetical protein
MTLDLLRPERLARLAAYGAYGVVAGLVAVYAALVAVTWPVQTGGMNWGMARVTWICLLPPVLAVAAAHVALARQLLGVAVDLASDAHRPRTG